MKTKKSVSPATLGLKQLSSPLIYLLAAAAGVSLLTSHYADAGVIAVVIVLNTVLGFAQEYKAERALESLRSMTSPHANILRGGKVQDVEAANIVPGDILILETGDRVAADGRIIESRELEVDESLLTGDSEAVLKQEEPVEKDAALGDRASMVWMSTSVTGGRGKAVITATGMASQLGKIAGQVEAAGGEEPPLQKRMGRLGITLGIAGVVFAMLIFGLGIFIGYDFLEMALFSVAVAVSAIPEGLPAVISVTLALGVQRMAARKAVIRSLPAVETLGSTTVICSDKTGTITRNEMTVTRLFAGGLGYKVTGDGYSAEGDIVLDGDGPEESADKPEGGKGLAALLEIGLLANNARIVRDGSIVGFEGSPTEKAILACSVKGLSGKIEELREKERLGEIPFSSTAKYMAVLLRSDSGAVAYVKGAPDRVIDFCSHVFIDGEMRELDANRRQKLMEENEEMASGALRVIAAAEKNIQPQRDFQQPAPGGLFPARHEFGGNPHPGGGTRPRLTPAADSDHDTVDQPGHRRRLHDPPWRRAAASRCPGASAPGPERIGPYPRDPFEAEHSCLGHGGRNHTAVYLRARHGLSPPCPDHRLYHPGGLSMVPGIQCPFEPPVDL